MREHEQPPPPGQPMPLPANNAPIVNPRSPLREISPPAAEEHGRTYDDREPRRRKVPSSPVTSAHFLPGSSETRTDQKELLQALPLSPTQSAGVIDLCSDSEVEETSPVGIGNKVGRSVTPGDEYAGDEDWDDPGFLEAVGQLEVQTESSRAASNEDRTSDIVILSSDSEDGDKENVPAPIRLVKRRTAPPRGEVIELSDD